MLTKPENSGNAEIDAGIGEADDPRQNELHFHLRRNTPTYLPFAAGILCVVARTNRKYLVDYPSRENIFMQLLRSLRELFHLVVERDRTVRTLEAARWNLKCSCPRWRRDSHRWR